MSVLATQRLNIPEGNIGKANIERVRSLLGASSKGPAVAVAAAAAAAAAPKGSS